MPTKFIAYKCKNGWLLNVYQSGKSESYIYDSFMKVLAKMADLGGEFDNEDDFFNDPVAYG